MGGEAAVPLGEARGARCSVTLLAVDEAPSDGSCGRPMRDGLGLRAAAVGSWGCTASGELELHRQWGAGAAPLVGHVRTAQRDVVPAAGLLRGGMAACLANLVWVVAPPPPLLEGVLGLRHPRTQAGCAR